MSNKVTSFHEAATEVQKYIDKAIDGWHRRIEIEYKEITNLVECYKVAGDARIGLNMEENIPRLVRKEISLIALQQAPRYIPKSDGGVDIEERAKDWLKDVMRSLKKHLEGVIDGNAGRSSNSVEAPLFFEKVTALHEQIDDIRHNINIKLAYLDFSEAV